MASLSVDVIIILFLSLKGLEESQEGLSEDLVAIKATHRKEEKKWMSEKEFLLRKIQFLGQISP